MPRRENPEPPRWIELLDDAGHCIGWYSEQGSEVVVQWPDGRTRTARASGSGNRGLAMLILKQGASF